VGNPSASTVARIPTEPIRLPPPSGVDKRKAESYFRSISFDPIEEQDLVHKFPLEHCGQ
jgi:hypothetical protein